MAKNFYSNTSLKSILNDFSSGSQELNEKILNYLLSIKSKDKFVTTLNLLKSNFKTFEVIQTNLTRIEEYFYKKGLLKSKEFIKKIKLEYLKSLNKIIKELITLIPKDIKIITISNSKTILDILLELKKRKFNIEVFALESLPGGEGKIFYNYLIQSGIHAHLVPDNKLKNFTKMANLTLVGMDSLLPDKWVINKIGTKRLCRMMQREKKKVIVIGVKSKIIKDMSKIDHQISNKRSKELILFERIPLKYFNHILIK